ncbi:MAG: hypothetical protein N2203_04570 [Bacteroidia bacterium]|nr:hypothetical protein [Bacteroidia bacterium]
MEKKKKSLITSAIAAASLAAMTNINASTAKIEMNVLGNGSEIRSELLSNKGISKMLNDLKCGENKTENKTEKSKGKEGKCGEGKCGEKKAKGKEGKCGEGKCGEKKAKGKEGKCGEGKCGEKKTKEQPK